MDAETRRTLHTCLGREVGEPFERRDELRAAMSTLGGRLRRLCEDASVRLAETLAEVEAAEKKKPPSESSKPASTKADFLSS